MPFDQVSSCEENSSVVLDWDWTPYCDVGEMGVGGGAMGRTFGTWRLRPGSESEEEPSSSSQESAIFCLDRGFCDFVCVTVGAVEDERESLERDFWSSSATSMSVRWVALET